MLAILIPVLLASCAPNPESVLNQEKFKRGEEIFNQHCASCHNKNAREGAGPSLVSPEIKKAIEETEEGSEVEQIILKGKAKMPSFEKKISHLDIHNLLQCLLSIQE